MTSSSGVPDRTSPGKQDSRFPVGCSLHQLGISRFRCVLPLGLLQRCTISPHRQPLHAVDFWFGVAAVRIDRSGRSAPSTVETSSRNHVSLPPIHLLTCPMDPVSKKGYGQVFLKSWSRIYRAFPSTQIFFGGGPCSHLA